jgi:hypothetical protein
MSSTETTATGGTTSIIMATDLLSSLPALQSIPKILLDAGADRSVWDLRQCLEQQARSSSTNGTEVAHLILLAGSNSTSRNSLADHISAQIAQHQEERYQPKGESVRYRYCIDEEPNTTTRKKNDDADDDDADDNDEAKLDDPNRLTLRTYVERIDSHNGTSTYLSEVYVIETTTASDPSSSTTAIVSGSVRLHTFFYGEGCDMITTNGDTGLVNVQTQLERHFAKRTIVVQAAAATVGSNKNQEEEEAEEAHHDSVNTTSGSSVSGGQPHQADPSAAAATTTNMESLATAIVRALVQFVDEQVLLPPAVHPPQEAIATAASSLQRLRRVLPITKMRFRWDAAAQRHVQLLNGRQQQEQR